MLKVNSNITKSDYKSSYMILLLSTPTRFLRSVSLTTGNEQPPKPLGIYPPFFLRLKVNTYFDSVHLNL